MCIRDRRIAVGAGVALFWLLIWEGLALLVRQELLIPTPMTCLLYTSYRSCDDGERRVHHILETYFLGQHD